MYRAKDMDRIVFFCVLNKLLISVVIIYKIMLYLLIMYKLKTNIVVKTIIR